MTAGLRFREQMTGTWSPETNPDVGNVGQYIEAAEAGERAGRVLDLRLTLHSPDVERLIDDLSVPIPTAGTVAAGGLLDAPVEVDGATVQLVVDDLDDPGTEHMQYHLPLPSAGLHLEGFKVLSEGDPTQLWGASTTLFVTLHRDGPAGEIVGRGIVRISPGGFAKQLGTIEITDEESELRRLALAARFGTAFFGALWDDYGNVIHPSTRFRRNAPPRPHRVLDVPRRQLHAYRTEDGVDLRLTRYRGGDRGPVVLSHGMGGNPRTYTLDTIKPNLLEYLVGHGFDVWLHEWRGSTALPSSRAQFDADQVARFDNPAAEATIREETGKADLHWVTHCVSAMTWSMSTLAGWTTPASLVLSQVGAHPVAAPLTDLKGRLRAPNLLRALGLRYLTTDAYDDESIRSRLFDFLLRFHPIPRDERCDSAVCRRLAFIYGVAVHHPAVDDETHDTLHELFGITNLRMMTQLGACAREQRLVTADGEDSYLQHVERLRLPITMISGAHNLVWDQESTRLDHEWLTSELGPAGFTRLVFEHNGHQDSFMGAEAYERGFPAVVDHLERAGC